MYSRRKIAWDFVDLGKRTHKGRLTHPLDLCKTDRGFSGTRPALSGSAKPDSHRSAESPQSLEVGRVEFSRAHRMLLDLDHFKQINDEYGHLVGDHVLQEFAKRCKHSVHELDLVGRYGGEELIIILPETDRKTSIQVAERLRKTIASTPIKVFDKEIQVTVSIGMASQDENTTDLETLIARADRAMYITKHKGRNRVAMSK
jgi:diguanylate cyclase (GGDEF)-like protein